VTIRPQVEAPATASAARLAGLLADRDNLRVFAAVALGAATIEEVLAATALDAEAAGRAVGHLVAGGLVDDAEELRVDLNRLRAAARTPPPHLPGATPEQDGVLRNFVDEHGRLRELPARAGRRRIVLEYLAGLFECGVDYLESEVNETLRLFHGDHASLRRYLVDAGLLERENGVYRRVER
jgi:hypothetical protein